MSENSFRFNYGVNLVFFTLVLSLAPYATGQVISPTPPPPPPPPVVLLFEPKIKVSPPLAIILACLVTAFFVMGCVSVYLRQCFERQMALSFTFEDDRVDSGRFFRRASAAAHGLDPSIIDSFPTFVYSEVKGLKIGNGELECAVCLNEFEDDETLRLLPKCSHVFHPDCIDAWLASHVTCPVCRATLVPKPGETGLFSRYLLSHDSDSNLVDSPNLREIQDFGDPRLARVVDDLPTSVQSSPDVINHIQTPNRDRPPHSTPRKMKNNGKFPRSHSTGHSLVQPGENCERFTLRLPEEVRNRLLNTSLSRTSSCMAFPRARSSRKGYRSSSVGTGRGKDYYYERFDEDVRSDRWVFTTMPPFVSRSGSARSQKMVVGDEVTATPKSLFKSVKSPLDRFLGGRDKDNIGERSIDRLRLDDQV